MITFNDIQQNSVLATATDRKENELNESINTPASSSLAAILGDSTMINTFHPELYSCPISDNVHLKIDRAVSVSMSDEKMIAEFIKKHRYGINLLKSYSLRETRPKRIIFLGSAVINSPDYKQLFSCEQTFSVHFNQSHPNSPFPTQNFETESSDKVVSLDQSSRPFYDCPVCSERFTNFNILERHLIHQHEEYHPYICEICGKKFKRKYRYTQHVKNYEIYQDCSTRKCYICKKM